jgi:hypothetical protein
MLSEDVSTAPHPHSEFIIHSLSAGVASAMAAQVLLVMFRARPKPAGRAEPGPSLIKAEPDTGVGKMYPAFEGCALPMPLEGTWYVPALPSKPIPRLRPASNRWSHLATLFKDIQRLSPAFQDLLIRVHFNSSIEPIVNPG